MTHLVIDVLGRVAPHKLWQWRARRWTTGPEEEEIKLVPALCSRRRTSIDVGASAGLYTLHMLGFSRDCFAFEPRYRAYSALVHKFGRTRPRVTIEAVALSDREGTAEMIVVDGDLGRSTIESRNPVAAEYESHRETVTVRRLDDYSFHGVGCIKIDVEGHEEAVLRGARGILQNDRPTLIIEIEERHNSGTMGRSCALLEQHDYRGYYLYPGTRELHPIEELHPELPIADGRLINNFLFLNASHLSRIRRHGWRA